MVHQNENKNQGQGSGVSTKRFSDKRGEIVRLFSSIAQCLYSRVMIIVDDSTTIKRPNAF